MSDGRAGAMTLAGGISMVKTKCYGFLALFLLALLVTFSNSDKAFGQSSNSPAGADVKRDRLNFEVQLHLLVASNMPSEKGNLPQSFDSVIKQLRPSLPFANYRLAATFVNRVKDGGTFEVSGVSASDWFNTSSTAVASPTFYQITLSRLKLETDDPNQPGLQIEKFRFGLRLPITTSTARAGAEVQSFPVINYESAGITTEMSLREGTATIVGTMNTSRADQILILVISVKRTL